MRERERQLRGNSSKSPGRWSLRSGTESLNDSQKSPRGERLKRRAKSGDKVDISPKKSRVGEKSSSTTRSSPRKQNKRDESPESSSESSGNETAVSPRSPRQKRVQDKTASRNIDNATSRRATRNNSKEAPALRKTRSPVEDDTELQSNARGKRRTNKTTTATNNSNSRADKGSSVTKSKEKTTTEKVIENGHAGTSEEDKDENKTELDDDTEVQSVSSTEESGEDSEDSEGDDSDDEDEDDENEEDEEDSDMEITMGSTLTSKDATILTLHKRLGNVQRQLQDVRMEFADSVNEYEKKLKSKDEKLLRLKNDLNWKEEQLDAMNEMSSKNMELESKLNHILGDKKAYDDELKRIKDEEIKAEEEKEQMERKEKEEKQKQEEEEKTREKRTRDKKHKKGEPDEENTGKRKRRRRGEKKEQESEGEDIDALFVSDDEVEIIEEKEPETIDITGDEGDEQSDSEVPASPKKQSGKKNKAKRDVSPKKSSKSQEKEEVINEDDQNETASQDSQDGDDDKKDKHGRHTIRKVMTGKKLQEETVKAAKTEKERRERAKKEHDKHEVIRSVDPKTKLPICTKLVLAFKEQTEKEREKKKPKEPLVEVNSRLIKKLKPHQWEAVEFVWDNIIESMDKLKEDEPGQGCILAHCMGLGKTLTMITMIHTLLSSEHTEQFTTCLVVCPLNVVKNWEHEWTKWLDKKDRLPVFEMASCKHGHDRAKLLKEWHQTGGVMIMGYQLFRILANYNGRSKKHKKTFEESLTDPGPDIVICDEGHILKNDNSAISKAMNKMRTKRRVALTGTPLQNNLVEYHCMVNFVKPNLLGNSREFRNRFANPITNGQHSDSTAMDVKVMKRRAHILHSMLEGCVQRKDYTELTKLLPPKYEYVLSVRLSELQILLYEKYLAINRTDGSGATVTSGGTGLFSDYQALMRIWTHPWVLRLDEMRQEKKAFEYQDDELDELDEEDEEDILISSDTEDDENQKSTTENEDDEEDDNESEDGTAESGEDENGDYRPSKKNQKLLVKIKRRSARVNKEKEEPSGNDSEASSRPSRSKGKGKSERLANGASDAGSSKSSKQQKKDDKKGDKKKEAKKNGKSSRVATDDSAVSSATEDEIPEGTRKAKVLAGEVIRQWKSSFRHGGNELLSHEDIHKREESWWAKHVNEEEHKKKLEISGKLILLFEIVRMAETLGDKVLVFSQSLLSLDLIEDFLSYKDEEAEAQKPKKGQKPKFWKKGEDYLRMDGSTGAQTRSKFTNDFNDPKDSRLRLFLISTKAGGLGINLDSANRVIIFDASWNPSHDVQSIFRVYRFGQVKPVYVYRLLAQGTMEEKIYERQVTKETLSQRVIDEHQIDRHFTMNDLAELYNFKPDRLNDPDAPKRPTPKVPVDVVLAELMTTQKDWIVTYHEHDSLLENRPEENLSEEEREKAWEEYEREKKGLYNVNYYAQQQQQQQQQQWAMQQQQQNAFQQQMQQGTTNQMTQKPFVFDRATGTYVRNIVPSAAPRTLAMMQPLPQTKGLESMKVANASQQLPRVVQEILKYNPNISTMDLQKRLQAFLGMQNRYQQTVGRPVVSMNQGQVVLNSSDRSASPSLGTSSLGAASLSTADLSQPPSRLPQPGNVPANKQA